MIGLLLMGFFAALLAGLGLGGGVLLIPALVLLWGMEQQEAQLYSLLTYIPIALSAMAVHLKGQKLNWNTLLLILPFGIMGAICGALLAGVFPTFLLRKAYGAFLLIFGLFQAFGLLKEIKEK